MKTLLSFVFACLSASVSTTPLAADAARHGAQPASCDNADSSADMQAAARRIVCVGAPHRLWIVAELHGTRETPELVEALLDQASTEAPVTLALEIPRFEQPALDAYLASPGAPEDAQRWLATPFWSAQDRDGRNDQAMAQLIEQVRQWRHQGRRISVLATEPDYDAAAVEKAGGFMARKEEGIAEAIGKALSSGSRVVALMGNYHARYADLGALPGAAAGQSSVVERLADASPLLVWVTAVRGQAWVCMGQGACGVHDFGGDKTSPAHPGLDVDAKQGAKVIVARLELPSFTASLPAVKQDKAP